jgi:hypothetical protein
MANLTPYTGTIEAGGINNVFPARLYGDPPAGSPFIGGGSGITQYIDPSQPTVVNGYVAKPWPGGEHRKLKSGNILILFRSEDNVQKNTTFEMHTFLNVGQFNRKLRNVYNKGMEVLNNSTKLPSNLDLEYLDRLKDTSEDLWFADSYGEFWRKLSINENSRSLEYLSQQGILKKINILGGIVNDMGATSGYNTEFKVLNVGVKHIVYLDNIWGKDTDPSTNLWLILKRLYNNQNEEYEEFALVPYSSLENMEPPLKQLQYRDISGNLQKGRAFYIGRVLDNEYKAPSPEIRLKSIGLLGSSDDQHSASALLKQLKVDIKPKAGQKIRFY